MGQVDGDSGDASMLRGYDYLDLGSRCSVNSLVRVDLGHSSSYRFLIESGGCRKGGTLPYPPSTLAAFRGSLRHPTNVR